MASTFLNKGYTLIFPLEGQVIDESLIRILQSFEELVVTEKKIKRNSDGFATAVTVPTATFKRLLEKKGGKLAGIIATSDIKIADAKIVKSFNLQNLEIGARLPAGVYVEKTQHGIETYIPEVQASESEWPDRLKRWALPAFLAGAIGGIVYLGWSLAKTSEEILTGEAQKIGTATDINARGKERDGLDKVIKQKSGDKSFKDTEEKRREEKTNSPPSSPAR